MVEIGSVLSLNHAPSYLLGVWLNALLAEKVIDCDQYSFLATIPS